MHPLAELLKKPLGARIVGYLAVSPLRMHTAQELHVRLKFPSKKINSALDSLEDEGWIQAKTTQGKKLVILNTKHAAAFELRQALLKDKPVPNDDLMLAVRKLGQVRAAFLSGLFTGCPQLPADLLVVGQVKQEKLKTFLEAAQKLLGLEINYTTMTREEFLARQNMTDRFLRDLFDHPYLTVVDKL